MALSVDIPIHRQWLWIIWFQKILIQITFMSSKCSCGPIPDSIKIFGVDKAPADKIVSFVAVI